MVTGHVVDFSIFCAAAPSAIRLSRGSMMNHMQVYEASRGPAEHIGLGFIHQIGAGAYPESAKRIPAGTAVDFDSAPNVKDRVALEYFFPIGIVIQNATAKSDFLGNGKPLETSFPIHAVKS